MITPGKLRGLGRMADERGTFSMLAVDQRPPVRRLVAERRGTAEADMHDLTDLKRALVAELAAPASAVLVDPTTAWPSLDLVGPRQGLVLTLEDSQFTTIDGERRSAWIDDWSVDKIKRAGADGVKLLAWYRPDASAETLAHQHDVVRRTGDDCRRFDLPFVLELLLHPLPGDDGPLDPQRHGELVLASVEQFAAAEYGVDLFKVESPVPAAELDPGGDSSRHAHWFADLDAAAARPWVLLSGGMDRPRFDLTLDLAFAAGASGFLAGRTIWWPAVEHFPDWGKVVAELAGPARSYLESLIARSQRSAAPWWDRLGSLGDPTELLDPAFRHGYASIA